MLLYSSDFGAEGTVGQQGHSECGAEVLGVAAPQGPITGQEWGPGKGDQAG